MDDGGTHAPTLLRAAHRDHGRMRGCKLPEAKDLLDVVPHLWVGVDPYRDDPRCRKRKQSGARREGSHAASGKDRPRTLPNTENVALRRTFRGPSEAGAGAVHEPPRAVHEPPRAVHEPPRAVHEPPRAVHE